MALLITRARRVGRDVFGNVYYESRARRGYKYTRRYVIYKGAPDPSCVPPEWHGWLHSQTDVVPIQNMPSYRRLWQKLPLANQTGTNKAYFPTGHFSSGSERASATGDYVAWVPEVSVPEILTKERKILR